MSDSVSLRTDITDREDTVHAGQPLEFGSAYEDEINRHANNILPNLPSHRFRFSVWHELSDTRLKGHELRAPRVRDGPPIKHEMFYKLQDENGRRIHHSRKGKDWKNYREETENWPEVVKGNLSYQNLSHNYQMDNFIRVLSRLRRVEELNLIENELIDVSSVTFPRCTILNMSRNYLKSFKHLPHLPKIEHLILDDNVIANFKGMDSLRKSPIISLSLRRCPVSFTGDYRQRVFSILPGLKFLDGLPKQPEDEEFDEPQPSSCVVS